MSLAVVGNLTLDELERSGRPIVHPGGTAFFSSLAAACLGARVSIVSNVGPDYPTTVLSSLKKNMIDVTNIRRSTEETTRFRLSYTRGSRRLELVQPGCEITRSGTLRNLDSVHLGPVFNEIGIDVLSSARRRCKFLSVDVQGLLRRASMRGQVRLVKRNIGPFLSLCNMVKATVEEARIIAPARSPIASAKKIIRRGADYALITRGRSGSLLATKDGIVLKVPSVPERREVDRTGAGDVFVGSWLRTYVSTNDMFWASAVAAAFASLAVRRLGMDKFSFAKSELLRRAEWAYERSKLVKS